MKESRDQLFCSFCGKPKELINRLIAGPNGIFICDECIEVCHSLILDDAFEPAKKKNNKKVQPPKDFKLPTPAELKAHLDEYVIGQDDAKKTLVRELLHQTSASETQLLKFFHLPNEQSGA